MRAAAAALAALLIGSVAAPAQAATYTVTTTADGQDALITDLACETPAGECTLRAAVDQADFDPGLDTVVVGPGTYLLDEPNLEATTGDELGLVTTDIALQGAGAGSTTIRQDLGPVIEYAAPGGSAEISGVTITGGVHASVGAGLRIGAESAVVTLRDAAVTGNEAIGANGGGIWSIGSLTLIRSTVSANIARFGGHGGGIYSDDEASLLRVLSSTVSGNSVDGDLADPGLGGGIFVDGTTGQIDGPAELDRSTVSGNVASGPGAAGGGIHSGGELSIVSSTFADNRAAAGANLYLTNENSSSAVSRNSLFADPLGPANCAIQPPEPGPVSGGHNLDADGSCGLASGPGDLVGLDPLLGPLAANGGPTLTHAPAPESPAVDRGSAPGETGDQRGELRPADSPGVPNAATGDGSDIGAIELAAFGTCRGRAATIVAAAAETTGTAGPDVIVGADGPDTIDAKGGKDLVCGGGGNDRLKGGGGRDRLRGEAGKDKLRDGGGRDRLEGGAGRDKLRGGPGRDKLKGGPGKDVCKGGPGNDKLSSCEHGS